MISSFSLKLLTDLSRDQRDAAAKKLGQLNSRELAANQKLSQLLDYRQDYQVRFQGFAKNGIEQTEWRNFLAFMGKLDAAIAEQHKTVTHTRNIKEAGGNELLARQRKLKSYNTLSQRRERTEILIANKREQREQDEHTANSAAHGKFAFEHE